jgi:beta-lactamase regulating signal transducer with metallopeptidase domain
MAKRKKHNWPELIKEQELSGETVDAFCKVRKIHYTSFYKNRKRLKSSNFVEIKVNKKKRELEEPITLKYGKYSIVLPSGFCKQTLKEALSVLDGEQC